MQLAIALAYGSGRAPEISYVNAWNSKLQAPYSCLEFFRLMTRLRLSNIHPSIAFGAIDTPKWSACVCLLVSTHAL